MNNPAELWVEELSEEEAEAVVGGGGKEISNSNNEKRRRPTPCPSTPGGHDDFFCVGNVLFLGLDVSVNVSFKAQP